MAEQFAEVLAGCKIGDPQAMRLFVVEFYGTLMRTARRRLGNDDRARDAVQSFFVMLLEKQILIQFRGDRLVQLRKFLNVCLSNHINSELKDFAQESHETALDADSLESCYPSTEQEYERKSIRELMLQIDWKYRQVLDLELDYYKQKEIAAMLQMPMGTVASYSHRAKEALSKLLKAHGFSMIPFFLTIMLQLRLAA